MNNNTFNFTTNESVHGLIVDLIDNNPYSKLDVDIWIGSLYTGSFEVLHYADLNDDYFGANTAIFRTKLKPFKTTETIKIKIKTKLLYNDQISMKLLTS